jgi:5-(carboxyamino)imidazole ribonucleotide synthase
VSTEFENVPAASLDFLARTTFVAPAGRCVAVAQDRIAEKRFIEASGVPVAPHVVSSRRPRSPPSTMPRSMRCCPAS